jgi:hypothetical protein
MDPRSLTIGYNPSEGDASSCSFLHDETKQVHMWYLVQ